MTIAVEIIAIIFMLTLMFIGIWSFVIANKAYSQFKYKNYLLEKISNQLTIANEKLLSAEETKTPNFTKTDDVPSDNDESSEEDDDDELYFGKQEVLNEVTPLFEIKQDKK